MNHYTITKTQHKILNLGYLMLCLWLCCSCAFWLAYVIVVINLMLCLFIVYFMCVYFVHVTDVRLRQPVSSTQDTSRRQPITVSPDPQPIASCFIHTRSFCSALYFTTLLHDVVVLFLSGDELLTVKTPAFAESVTEGDVRWEKGWYIHNWTPTHFFRTNSACVCQCVEEPSQHFTQFSFCTI